VVNLRYVLFATTLSPHLKGVRQPTLSWLAYTLTDETFAINIADRRQGLSTPASMAGVGAISWTGWVLGTLAGAVGAAWIGDPTRWGVEFAMPAMFSALFIALAEDRRHVIVGLFAAGLALALPLLAAVGLEIQTSWLIVIASIGAATVASVVYR
jgi:predicted branched-subunit amino acid permease